MLIIFLHQSRGETPPPSSGTSGALPLPALSGEARGVVNEGMQAINLKIFVLHLGKAIIMNFFFYYDSIP